MATDIKISQMPAATSLAGDELIPIVQSSSNKTTTVSKIKEGLATSEQLANKVDKDGSKVLSDKNFTSAYETKLKGIAANANNYVHPSTAGNKHIPSGGSSGQILRWSADGTATWGADNNTTYSVATSLANGLMSSADKSKLDGIENEANNYVHPKNHPATIIQEDSTHKFVTEEEKTKIGTIEEGANNYVLPTAGASLGGVKQGAAVEDATSAEDIVAQFNALLASLRTAGVIAASAAAASMMAARSSETVIDFVPPMPLEKGKLYKENGIVYRCIQTSKLSISNKLSDLVGHYVELV